MMDLFTIYSYGGSTTLFYIFNAIAMLFKSNFADQIFKIMTMFGLVWAGMRSSFNQDKIVPYAKWFLSYLTVMLVLIQPPGIFGENKVQLHIRDVVIPGKAYSVSNIPPGLILPATFINGLGYSVTKAFETVFTLADYNYLPYNQYGTMFGAQVMSELRNYKIQNPLFRENMEGYISNCMMYDVMIGKKYNINELYNEKDVLTLLTNHASNLRMFNYRYDKERKLLTCKEGIAELSKFFNDEINLFGGKFATLSNIGSKIPVRQGTDPASPAINNGFLRAFEAGLSFYSNNNSGAEQLRQILIINAFKDIPASYGTLRAVQNQNTAWRYTGEMAQQVLPIMHALFQALIYASFPIVVCLVFFPSGFRALGAYIGMMIWIELWAPLFAVLNLVVSVFAKAAGGVNAITIDNINNIASVQSSYAMAASSLGMLVPVLSYMIIKGGAGQFVHIASQMLGASTAGVASAAQEVVSGNRTLDHVSIGDQSFHNVNANKYDTTGSIAIGQMKRILPSGITQIELADGRVIFAGGGGASSSTGNLNITSSQRIAQNLSSGIQNEQSIVASQNKELSQSIQDREAQSVSFLAKIAENETKGERYEFHGSVSDMEKMRQVISDTKAVRDTYKYDWDQCAKVALGLSGKAGAGTKGSSGISASGNANANGTVAASSSNNQGLSEEGSIQSQNETDKALDVVSRISKDAHYSKTQTTEKDLSDQINVSHEKIKQKSESIAFHQANAARMQETLDFVQSKDFQVNQNNLDEFISFIAEKRDLTGSKIGKTKAATMIENIASNRDAQQYLLDFQRSRIPEQQMPSRLTMNDAQKKIQTQIKDAKIENTTQAFKDKIKQEHFGDHNTDGTDLKKQYESKESEAKQKIEEQRMKTDKKGDVIKNKINKHENKKIKRVLNFLGIGKANPYRNKNWKDG